MTKEPPKGLRANLRSTYVKMDDDKLKRTCKPVDFRKMLFGELPENKKWFLVTNKLNDLSLGVLHSDLPIIIRVLSNVTVPYVLMYLPLQRTMR